MKMLPIHRPRSSIEMRTSLGQRSDSARSRELKSLTGVDDLEFDEPDDSVLQGIDAEAGAQCVRQTPTRQLANCPIHNGQKAGIVPRRSKQDDERQPRRTGMRVMSAYQA